VREGEMKNPKRSWIDRYWFYTPLMLTATLSLLVIAFLADTDALDAYALKLLGVPLLLLNGAPAILGLFVHAFEASCRDSSESD
jgi:hypothetical protein